MKNNRRLLIVNYTLDRNHKLLSHQVDIAKTLVEEFEYVHILTMDKTVNKDFYVDYEIIRDKNRSKLGLAFRYYYLFFKLLRNFKPEIVFFHMSPRQSALIAPLLRLLGVRQLLWYAHKSKPISLVIASIFCDKILTCSTGSLTIETSKKIVTGHHVDEKLFTGIPHLRSPKIGITIGRLDINKNLGMILESFEFAFENGLLDELHVVGTPSNENQAQEFNLRLSKLGLAKNHVKLLGAFSRSDLSGLLSEADIFLHASVGSLDKAPIEAILMGLPVATINEEFRTLFGSWAPSADSNLNDEIMAISEAECDFRISQLEMQRGIAQRNHTLVNWVENFSKLVNTLPYKLQ
jgi:glycosyltransferase involved in cell wall biosynthesis